jgi:hypothetical protein
MKLFEVKAGTSGYLVGSDGNRRPWKVRKDLCFDREEMLMDVVVEHNADLYAWCKDMEQKGYSNLVINDVLNFRRGLGYDTFERDGPLLMVPDTSVRVL